MGYSKLNVEDVEGAGPGGAFHFVRRELGVLAFGVNWIELRPGAQGHEHDERDSGHEEVNVVVAGSGTYRVDGSRAASHARAACSTTRSTRCSIAAVHTYLDDFGHDEADVLRRLKPATPSCKPPMVVRIVLWNLADSKTTIEELRRYLRDEAVDEFAEVEGLRFKAWISDALGERWGAFYLFESREAADQAMPTGARELIGKDPDLVEEFDLEATVEGRYLDEELSRLGLAFE